MLRVSFLEMYSLFIDDHVSEIYKVSRSSDHLVHHLNYLEGLAHPSVPWDPLHYSKALRISDLTAVHYLMQILFEYRGLILIMIWNKSLEMSTVKPGRIQINNMLTWYRCSCLIRKYEITKANLYHYLYSWREHKFLLALQDILWSKYNNTGL